MGSIWIIIINSTILKFMKILIIGKGYLGSRMAESWSDAVITDKIIKSKEDVLELIDEHKPDAILNAAGITGKPNVDWCEDHQLETIEGNTILPIEIAKACQERNVYLLHLGTGCIFYGSSPHADGVWREDDYANPVAVYTRSKYAADLVLATLPNIGIARLRMPIDDHPCSPNLIDKITRYEKIVDVVNSVTVVDDLVMACRKLLEKKAEGVYHTVNPGAIKHREIIDMYKELVDPEFTCEWVTEEEMVEQGLVKKKRSNNIMDSSRLEALGIHMRPIKEALRDAMEKYAKHKNDLDQDKEEGIASC